MKKFLSLTLSLLLLVAAFAGCGSESAENADAVTVESFDDLNGLKIAVQEGTTGDVIVTEDVEASEVVRFKKAIDAGIDLKNGKVDAVVIDELPAQNIVESLGGLKIVSAGDAVEVEEYAIAVKKGDTEMVEAVNATLKRIAEDGTLDKIVAAYISNDEEALAEIKALPAPTGDKKIIMGTNAEFAPFEFRNDANEIDGYDIAIAKEIARDMGAELVIEDVAFDTLVTALSTGKFNFVAAGMTATDERREVVDFSETYYTTNQVIIVKE